MIRYARIMQAAEPQLNPVRVGLVSDHLFPFAHGGAERVYRVLADAITAEGAQLRYFTRRQWEAGTNLQTAFSVDEVWSGEIYDSNGTRRIGSALKWSAAVMRALWRAELDILIVSATPVFNVFVGAVAKLRHPQTVLVVDWLEIWPWQKWRHYSGWLAGNIAWLLQSIAVHIGDVRLVNSTITRDRLPRRAQSNAIALPLASMAGPPVANGSGVASAELLFVGRHIPDKNLPMLPRVVAALRAEFPRLRAKVIGDGPDRAIAEQLASDLGLADSVEFLGRVSDAELETQLAAAGTLFFPSVREGFGLVVCEAARFGTPAVVVNHPDNAAVALVAEGMNGAIAAQATLDELVGATRRVLLGGGELRASTQAWYADAWSHGGFNAVARKLIGLVRP